MDFRRPRLVWLDGFFLVLAMVIAAVLTRMGLFGQVEIGWDEGTFAALGARVAAGELPYVTAFDVKPPVMFLALGGAFAAFGKSIVVIRAASIVCVALGGVLVAAAVRARTADTRAALSAGLLFVTLNADESAAQFSTEALAGVFVSAALLVLAGRKATLLWALTVGALVSLAVLTRTNLAFLAVGFGSWLGWRAVTEGGFQHGAMSLGAYVIGGLVPLAALLAVYASADALSEFWFANVTAPLSYAGHQMDAASAAARHAALAWARIEAAPVAFGMPLIVGVAGSAMLGARSRKSGYAALLTSGALAVVVSILWGGAAYEHYWVQLYPFAAVAAGLTVLRSQAPRAAILTATGCAVLISAIDLRSGTRPSDPASAAAAAIIADRSPEDRTVVFVSPIILFLLDEAPLSRMMTFPANVSNSALAGPAIRSGYAGRDEVAHALGTAAYTVTDARGTPGYLTQDQARAHDEALSAFTVLSRHDHLLVLKRREPAD